MSNPFDNVPSTADVQETTDKKIISSLSYLVERLEADTIRRESVIKNEEELAGTFFELFLDDDGTMKDFSHSAEIKSMLRQTQQTVNAAVERIETLAKSMPTSVEACLCDEDRNRLDKIFFGWNKVFKFHQPLYCVIGFIVGICILVCVLATKSATDKRLQYEHRLEQLDLREQQLDLRDSILNRYSTHYREQLTNDKN